MIIRLIDSSAPMIQDTLMSLESIKAAFSQHRSTRSLAWYSMTIYKSVVSASMDTLYPLEFVLKITAQLDSISTTEFAMLYQKTALPSIPCSVVRHAKTQLIKSSTKPALEFHSTVLAEPSTTLSNTYARMSVHCVEHLMLPTETV